MIHVRLIPIDIRKMDRTYSPPQSFFALLPSSISISYGHVPILTLFYVSRTQPHSLITSTHLHVLPLQPLPSVSTSPPLNSSPLIHSNTNPSNPQSPVQPAQQPKTLRYKLRKEKRKAKISTSRHPFLSSITPLYRSDRAGRRSHQPSARSRSVYPSYHIIIICGMMYVSSAWARRFFWGPCAILLGPVGNDGDGGGGGGECCCVVLNLV